MIKGILVMFLLMILGVMSYLFITGAFLDEPMPFLSGLTDSTKYNLFEYSTNAYYETGELAYNMEDKFNSTHLYDFALNDNHGNISLGTEGASGIYGDAISSPIEITTPDLAISGESWSIESWIYPTGEENMYLMVDNGTFPYISKFTNESMRVQWGGIGLYYSNRTVNLNAWNFVALTYNFTSKEYIWYMNNTATTVINSGSYTVATANEWSEPIIIGRFKTGQVASQFLGSIDEVRIFKGEVRTQSEIQTDMNTPMGLFLYINGNDGDVIQLWYNSTDMFQQNTMSGTTTEFNVYTFSGFSEPFEGIVKAFRDEMNYESPVIQFSYSDYYSYSVPRRYTLNDMGIFVALIFIFGLPMIIIPTIIIIRQSQ